MPANRNDDLRRLDEIERWIVKLGNELREAEQERQAIFRRLIVDHSGTGETIPAPKLLVTGDEAAELLSVCRKTLWSLTQPRGTIPVVSIGPSGIRYSVDSLRRWIEEQAHAAK